MEGRDQKEGKNGGLRRASTVILLREDEKGFLEVYLLRRSHNSSFMPGLYVFPGGSLEPWDENTGLQDSGWDQPLHRVLERLGKGLDPDQAMAHLLAAIRETFEEAGVLLAELDGGEIPARPLQGLAPEARQLRDLLLGKRARLQASRFSSWAHWITPEAMPLRFDTRFYLALHPEGQTCLPDQFEATQGLWIRPSDALLGNHEARIPLSPPGLVTLQELSLFQSLKELKSKAWDRGWGPPRIPRALKSPWGPLLIMPWDAQYSSREPDLDWAVGPPRYLPPLEPFSRLIQRNGIWLPVVA